VSHQVLSILVIDDDEEIRNTISPILSDEGYLVETAKNGKEAMKASKKTPFDLALVDIKLPDIEGTELIKNLKEAQPKMAAIIMTGYPTIENAIISINNKADGYILKPFYMPTLLETIKKILDEKSKAYFQMFKELNSTKSCTSVFKYETPDNLNQNKRQKIVNQNKEPEVNAVKPTLVQPEENVELLNAEKPIINEPQEIKPLDSWNSELKEQGSIQNIEANVAPPKARTEETNSSPKTECSHYFGYLSQRTKRETIPETCIECTKSIECLTSGSDHSKRI
jgi:DNA-binding response OmpR family regulator